MPILNNNLISAFSAVFTEKYMQTGKVFLRLFISCILLFVFLFKLTPTVFGQHKISKNNIALVNDGNDNQEDPEKKDNPKSDLNFNKEFDHPAESFSETFIYLTISNPHPNYRLIFFVDHYPTVATPPPNC